MARKRFSTEQIVTLLRQIEVMTAQGKPVPVAHREAISVRLSHAKLSCRRESEVPSRETASTRSASCTNSDVGASRLCHRKPCRPPTGATRRSKRWLYNG